VITRLGDRAIDSGPTLISEIRTHKPGDTVSPAYERDGKERTVRLALGEPEGER
jgi:putative serine protease PepD